MKHVLQLNLCMWKTRISYPDEICTEAICWYYCHYHHFFFNYKLYWRWPIIINIREYLFIFIERMCKRGKNHTTWTVVAVCTNRKLGLLNGVIDCNPNESCSSTICSRTQIKQMATNICTSTSTSIKLEPKCKAHARRAITSIACYRILHSSCETIELSGRGRWNGNYIIWHTLDISCVNIVRIYCDLQWYSSHIVLPALWPLGVFCVVSFLSLIFTRTSLELLYLHTVRNLPNVCDACAFSQ